MQQNLTAVDAIPSGSFVLEPRLLNGPHLNAACGVNGCSSAIHGTYTSATFGNITGAVRSRTFEGRRVFLIPSTRVFSQL